MSRRVLVSTLGASALLVSGIAGAPVASALAVDGFTVPSAQAFGTTKLFTTLSKNITVTVPGDSAAVTFPGVAATVQAAGSAAGEADFSVSDDGCAAKTVQPGGTCTVKVDFFPFDPGVRTARLAVESSAPASTKTVTLTGTATTDATGTYYGLAPSRLIDTRKGTGKPLGQNSTTTLSMGGFAGIPTSGVSAVVVNLTAVTTSTQGYFTIYPANGTRPEASSINYPKGFTGANMVTVPVSPDGKVKLYNYGGATHAVVDVLGWYAKDNSVQAAKGMGTQFFTTPSEDPERRYDSRQDPAGAFVGGDAIQFEDTWDTSAEAAAVKAYVVNVTAVDATREGVLTLWQGGSAGKPTVSTVNYVKGTIAPNMAVVPAGRFATLKTGFKLQNTGSGEVDVVVDLVGYYLSGQSQGMRFVPRATPKRLVDTRQPIGPKTVLTGSFGAGSRTVNATSVSGPDSYFVVANTTGIKPTVRTYLTVWNGVSTRPSASNLNVNPGVVRSASTYAPLRYVEGPPEAFSFRVYNDAGRMHLAMDVAGTFDYYPSAAAITPAAAARAQQVDGTGARTATTRRAAPTADIGDAQQGFVRR